MEKNDCSMDQIEKLILLGELASKVLDGLTKLAGEALVKRKILDETEARELMQQTVVEDF